MKIFLVTRISGNKSFQKCEIQIFSHCTKNEVFIKDFFSKFEFLLTYTKEILHEKLQFPTDLVTFTEEILNGKLHFLCSVHLKENQLKSTYCHWNFTTIVLTGGKKVLHCDRYCDQGAVEP